MGLNLDYIDGQIPIHENEMEGLLIETISSRNELNEFEQKNIEDAMHWVFSKKFHAQDVFTLDFIKDLHHRMFGEVWDWAGEFRITNKNLGVDFQTVAVELKKLCDDGFYWFGNNTYSPDEIALRFKHRLVSIHCFPNGNGRHSRLIADILIEKIMNQPPFSWGFANCSNGKEVRKSYLKAIKVADKGDYSKLLTFARS